VRDGDAKARRRYVLRGTGAPRPATLPPTPASTAVHHRIAGLTTVTAGFWGVGCLGKEGAAFERDRERDRALTVAGWRVIRVTWRQLRGEREAVAADIAKALASGKKEA